MIEKSFPSKPIHKTLTIVLFIFLIVLCLTWLLLTPKGLGGKTEALGYAICHQIDSHTISIGGKLLPLCARCTGTFLGLLMSLTYLLSRGRKTKAPSFIKILVLSFFALAFLVDGVNSTFSLLLGRSPLYQPNNLLRLATGLGFGLALANLLVPLWNQTLWVEAEPAPALEYWWQFGLLILFLVITFGLIIINLPVLYYAVALLSTVSIVLTLSLVYTLLWCIIIKKENSLHHWREGLRIFIAGVITAVIQVGLMDMIRFSVTGSWTGMYF